MDWASFLSYLSEPNGIAVAAGIVWSLLIEYWAQFEAMASKWKRLVFFVVCMALPLAAAALGVLTQGWPLNFEVTFWPAIVAGALAFGSGTVTHTTKLKVTE